MSRFAVAFVILGLIGTYGLWAVVAMLLAVIMWLGLGLYGAYDISEEITADLAQARQELEHAGVTVKALERSLATAKLSGQRLCRHRLELGRWIWRSDDPLDDHRFERQYAPLTR